jgi:hypothetical protein
MRGASQGHTGVDDPRAVADELPERGPRHRPSLARRRRRRQANGLPGRPSSGPLEPANGAVVDHIDRTANAHQQPILRGLWLFQRG